MALIHAAKSLARLEALRYDLGIVARGKPTLLGDNVSSHFLVRNSSLHRPSKHVDVHYHFIRERHEIGEFTLEFVSGKDNPADLLTKALSPEHVCYLSSLLFG